MFYGVDLALHDVVEFLKKKSDHQKEDVAKILLNKKFNKSMMEGSGQASRNCHLILRIVDETGKRKWNHQWNWGWKSAKRS